MTDITALQEKRKAYVREQAEKIVNGMVARNVTTDTLATCGLPNWDTELHNAMPQIAKVLDELGIRTTSSVNWGVTDWVFTVKI